jgi:hypothetical protein
VLLDLKILRGEKLQKLEVKVTTSSRELSTRGFVAFDVLRRSQNFFLPTLNNQSSYINTRAIFSAAIDHRIWKIALPVCSAVLKPDAGPLVLRWVTTWESWLLIVFCVLSGCFFSFSFLFSSYDGGLHGAGRGDIILAEGWTGWIGWRCANEGTMAIGV